MKQRFYDNNMFTIFNCLRASLWILVYLNDNNCIYLGITKGNFLFWTFLYSNPSIFYIYILWKYDHIKHLINEIWTFKFGVK